MTFDTDTEDPSTTTTTETEVGLMKVKDFDSQASLTQEIYAIFQASFPSLFKEEGEEVGDGGEGQQEEGGSGEEGEANSNNEDDSKGSPAKASPQKGNAEEGEAQEGDKEAEEKSPEKSEVNEPDMYEEKIQLVNKTCADFVSYVTDLEAYIQESQQRAKEGEEQALAEADKLYTSQWRDTGLPEMPSFLRLSEEKLESMNLLNPQNLWESIIAERDAKSAPPKTIEYFDNEQKGYLKTTNNLKVRSRILAQYPQRVTYKSLNNMTDQELLKKAKESEMRLKELSQKMSAAQWDEEVKILQRMKQKLNYTRNPRYLESKKVQRKDSTRKGTGTGTDKSFFKIEPENVEFRDYEVGSMYSMQLRMRNVSQLSRRARFLPPRSKYFSIANVEFPGSKNLLAPGMCCKCELYFQPDSLADYDDFFSIETDVDNFQVHVAARRPIPNLSVPKSFDCGPCLLGHTLITEFECKNSGGNGQFKVVGEEDWPNTEIDVTESKAIDLGPFTFEPSAFKLLTGDDMKIKISFLPQEAGNFVRNFKMLCDNCKIETFSITGVGVKLDITLESVDGKPVFEEEKEEEERTESLAAPAPYNRKVWFGEVVPGANHPRTISVRNNTPIPLAYHWLLEDKSYSTDTQGSNHSSSKIFQISPMDGVLGAQENSEFTFVFEPGKIESYTYGSRLMIESHSHTSKGSLLRNVIELDLEGSGKGVDINLSPAIVEFNGTMLFGKQYERDVTLVNNSKAPAKFSWTNIPPNVRISPKEALVQPESAMECDITVLASKLGKTDITVVNQIEHGPHLPLRVVYNVEGPKVKFLAPQIDFGLVEETKEVTATFQLQNCSDTQAEFAFKEHALPSRKKTDWILKFSEDSGVLQANETKSFVLSCSCSSAQALRTIVACQVLIDDFVCSEQKIAVRADVVAPLACLSTTELDVGVTYLNVSIERTVKLHNLTQLPSDYCWMPDDLLSEKVEGEVQVMVSPQKGTISPGKTEEFDVEIIPTATGRCDVILPCELQGMEEPLGLQIKTDVQGMSVKYEIRRNSVEGSSTSDEDLSIDFGDSLSIGRRASMTLIVHNESAIRAPVYLAFEKFGIAANMLTLDQQMGTAGSMSEVMMKSSDFESVKTVRKTKRKVQMAKTLTANKLESVLLTDSVVGKLGGRMMEQNDSTMLKEAGDFGVVFLASPTQGTLEPWGTAEFEITCINNMCGNYFDTLCCEVGDLPSKPIPVKAGVVGSPLALQAQAYAVKKSIDKRVHSLNWGKICMDSASESRKFWVSNTSPFDVLVEWTVKLLGEENNDSDAQVDVNLLPTHDGKVRVEIEERGKMLDAEFPFLLSEKNLLIPAGSVRAVSIDFAGSVPRHWKAVLRGRQLIQYKDPERIHLQLWQNKEKDWVEANIVGTFHPFAAHPCEPLGNLTVNLLANSIEPKLDSHGLDSLDFVCHSCVAASDASYKKSVTFTNLQSVTIKCRLSVEGPYKLLSVVPSSPQRALEKEEESEKTYIIPPGENVDIVVQYEKSKLNGEPDGLFENIEGLIKILFILPEGNPMAEPVSVQSFPVRTRLLYPKIALSADSINFENVHPNAPKVMELTLINPTVVDATWSIAVDGEKPPPRRRSSLKAPTEAPKKHESFEIAPTCGVIPGCGIGQPQKQKISISFHPEHDIEYKRQYRVKVKSGLGTFFALKGCGSYNEVLESDLALSLS